MKELIIGNTKLEYAVRESCKAKYKHVEITPGRIEVVVPRGTPPESICDFLEQEKKNIYTSFQEIQNKPGNNLVYEPVHYATGAKIRYYGRMEFLYVKKYSNDKVDIHYRNGFHILYPDVLSDSERDKVIKESLKKWMKKRIEKDVKVLITIYGDNLKLYPEGIRIKEQKHLWASCGKDRIININWKLIQLPRQVLEYVVIHELCHLKHRRHSKNFWILVGSMMPEYEKYRELLDKWVHEF